MWFLFITNSCWTNPCQHHDRSSSSGASSSRGQHNNQTSQEALCWQHPIWSFRRRDDGLFQPADAPVWLVASPRAAHFGLSDQLGQELCIFRGKTICGFSWRGNGNELFCPYLVNSSDRSTRHRKPWPLMESTSRDRRSRSADRTITTQLRAEAKTQQWALQVG
jgi:hypothetical protein